MMFDIPLPCTYEREISARRIVDEPDRYLPAIALLVQDDEVVGASVARAPIESLAGSLVVHTGCIRRNRASQIDFKFCCDRLKLLKPLARYIESTLFIFVLTRLYVAGHKAGDLSFNILIFHL